MRRLDEMTGPELRAVMNAVARAVRRQLPDDCGFIVLAADRLEMREDLPR